jgi:hypothetical protein
MEIVLLVILQLDTCEYAISISDYELNKTYVSPSARPINCQKVSHTHMFMPWDETKKYLQPFGGPVFRELEGDK